MKSCVFLLLLFALSPDIITAQNYSPGNLPSLIPYRKKDKWGYYHKDKGLVIPAIYTSAGLFDRGYAIVSTIKPRVGERPLEGEQAIIDSTGKEVYRWPYNENQSLEIRVTQGKRIHLWQNGRLMWVRNTDGSMLQPSRYKLQWTFNDEYYVARKKKYFGVVDSSGKIIVPFRYQHIGMMDKTGYALARKKDSTVGLINLQQKELFPFKEKNHMIGFGFDADGLAAITLGFDQPWGYIDTTGKIVIPMIYEEALCFTEGLAVVGKEGKQGVINIRGDTVVPFRYTRLNPFQNGRAQFTDGTETGCLDKQGNEIVRIRQQIIQYIHDDMLIVWGAERNRENNFALREFYQVVNHKGEPLSLFAGKYHFIYYPGNGLLWMNDHYTDMRGNKYYED